MLFSKDGSLNKSFSNALSTLPRVRIAIPVIIDRHSTRRVVQPQPRKQDDLVALFKSDLSIAVKRSANSQRKTFAEEFSRVNRVRNPERVAS